MAALEGLRRRKPYETDYDSSDDEDTVSSVPCVSRQDPQDPPHSMCIPRPSKLGWDEEEVETKSIPVSRTRLVLLVTLLALALYTNTLWGELLFDDLAAVVRNRDVRGDTSLTQLVRHDFWGTPLNSTRSHKSYRPIAILSLRANFALHQLDVVGYHAVNVVLNAVVVALFSVEVAGRILPEDPDRGGGTALSVVVASFLFVCHPIRSEGVASVVGRAELLSAIFVILSFASFVRSVEKHTRIPVQVAWFLASLFFAWMAALSKETGITVLAVNGMYDLLTCGLPSFSHWMSARTRLDSALTHRWIGTVVRGILLLVCLGCYLGLRVFLCGESTVPIGFQFLDNMIFFLPQPQKFFTALYVQAVYVFLLLFPVFLTADRGPFCVPIVDGIWQIHQLYSVIFSTIVILLLFHGIQQRNTRLLLGMAWYFIPMLPTMHFVIIGATMAERLLYLPTAGFCLLCGMGAERVLRALSRRSRRKSRTKRVFWIVLCIILVLCCVRVLVRNRDWKDGFSIFKSSYDMCDRGVKVVYNLGSTHLNEVASGKAKDIEASFRDIKKWMTRAVELLPSYTGAHGGLGWYYAHEENPARNETLAVKHFEFVFARGGRTDPIYDQTYGYLLLQQGNIAKAIVHLQSAVDSNPYDAISHLNLAAAYDAMGLIESAVKHYYQASTLGGRRSNLLNRGLNGRLGYCLLLLGDKPAAEFYLQKATRESPNEVTAFSNLGTALAGMKRFSEAIPYLSHALTLREDVYTLGNLAMALFEDGRVFEAEQLFRRILEEFSPLDRRAQDMLSRIARGEDAPHVKEARSAAIPRHTVKQYPEQSDPYKFVNGLLEIARNAMDLGQYKQAMELFKRMIDYGLDTRSEAGILQYLGICASMTGDKESAIAYCTKSLRMNPSVGGHVTLARLLYEHEAHDEARTQLTLAKEFETVSEEEEAVIRGLEALLAPEPGPVHA